jgi:hypothetical protein
MQDKSSTATSVVRDAQYAKIEQTIKRADKSAVLARWRFGRLMIEERGDRKQLPNGRRAQLAKSLQIAESEVGHRMRFAEVYPTKAEVDTAVATHGTWSAIRDSFAESKSTVHPAQEREAERKRTEATTAKALRKETAGDRTVAVQHSTEAAALKKAMAEMKRGADEVDRLIKRAVTPPPFEDTVAELDRRALGQQIDAIFNTITMLRLVYLSQGEPPKVSELGMENDPSQLRLATDDEQEELEVIDVLAA